MVKNTRFVNKLYPKTVFTSDSVARPSSRDFLRCFKYLYHEDFLKKLLFLAHVSCPHIKRHLWYALINMYVD